MGTPPNACRSHRQALIVAALDVAAHRDEVNAMRKSVARYSALIALVMLVPAAPASAQLIIPPPTGGGALIVPTPPAPPPPRIDVPVVPQLDEVPHARGVPVVPKLDELPRAQHSGRSRRSFSDRVTQCLQDGAAAGLGPNDRAAYSRACANQ
jgi:hypothetical protein